MNTLPCFTELSGNTRDLKIHLHWSLSNSISISDAKKMGTISMPAKANVMVKGSVNGIFGSIHYALNLLWFLPSATKLRRLCFYTCLSVHRGGLPQCMLGYPPEQAPPRSRNPPEETSPREQTPPPSRRLLLRTVRILLECILVLWCFPSLSVNDPWNKIPHLLITSLPHSLPIGMNLP